MKSISLTILTLFLSFALFATDPITLDSLGTIALCVGAQVHYIDSTTGGVWSISDTLIAKIDTSGTATGISAGIVTITYSVGASYVTKTVTVYPAPAPIIGPPYVCTFEGGVYYSDPTPGGGYWYILGTVVLLASGSHDATVSGGSYDGGALYFVDTAGCATSITVQAEGHLSPIIGDTIIYVDSTTTLLGAAFPLGTWNSTNPSVATVDSTGLVTGISTGIATISYTFGCIVSTIVTVLPPVSVPTLSTTNESGFGIYPNPTTTSLTITTTNKITSITITNLLGQTLYSQQYNSPQVQVDVSTLPTCMYLIRINGTEVRKFVKE